MNLPEVLAIIIPLIAMMGWVYSRIEKKLEYTHSELKIELNRVEKKLEYSHSELKIELKEIKADISAIKDRVSRIEGQLSPRPEFTPKVLEKKEE